MHSSQISEGAHKIEDPLRLLREENEMLRREVRVAREASEITARLVVEQFEETYRVLQLFQTANAQRQAVLDAALRISIIAADSEGTISLFNHGAEALLGYRASELVGKKNLEIFHLKSELKQAARELDQGGRSRDGGGMGVLFRYAVEGRSEEREWTYVRKDGSKFPVVMSVTPLRGPGGEINGCLCAAMDVTERKRTEEELQKHRNHLEQMVRERTRELTRANEELQAEIIRHTWTAEKLSRSIRQNELIMTSVGEGIYGVDLAGNTTFINPSAIRLTGYEPQEIIDRHQHEILHHSKQDRSPYPPEECPIYATMKDGNPRYITDEVFWRKDGTSFPVEYVSTPIREEERIIGAVVVFRDITERKQAEEDKAKIQAQLLQSQKMEAIGLLAGGVAHDFNNLLTTIQGYTSLAMMKIDNSGRLFRDLDQVRLAAERAANLTRQLLLFSRKQPTMPVPLNLNRTIDNLLTMLRRLIGEHIAISTKFEPGLQPILADEGNIEQLIVNLAVNARDAMPKGGKITISTENVTLDEQSSLTMSEARPGQFIRLSIADTGVGMDKETLSRIFEPFFTTKGIGKGTGLGLSVVYGIVRQHEGWINTHSEPGQGTAFTIYLPALLNRFEIDRIEETISWEDLQGMGKRILLVEDEESVRELTAMALTESGYVVVEAGCAEEALDIFEREKGNFHLVLSDMVLPDQSGLELVDQILLSRPEIPIILVSGYPDQKSQWSTIRTRELPFIQKPYTIPEILRSVKKLVEV